MKLTKAQAARFLLYRHGLLGKHIYEGKAGALAFVQNIGAVQYDPVDACGKNAELVLHSRVKGFKKNDLDELLYKDRALIDHWDKCMCILPVELWPYLSRFRLSATSGYYSRPEVMDGYEQVLSSIREKGSLCSLDVDIPKSVMWPWGETVLSRAAMESLYYRGDLIVHHKKGTRKYYDLPERHFDAALLRAPDPNAELSNFHAWQVKRRIGAVGLLWNKPSDAFLGIHDFNATFRNEAFTSLKKAGEVFPVEVEGISTTLYVRSEDMQALESVCVQTQFDERLELIAPLDSLLWDRRLIEAIFDFDYRWEIYTPEAKRKYGYYVLPLLYGDAFIGRVEAINDRKGKRLLVKNIWMEPGKKLPKRAFRTYLTKFAAWNGCKEIVMD